MFNYNMHPQRLARTGSRRQAWHNATRMDDTARELLGTTCTQHSQTKCMRVHLAENVS